MNVGLYKLHLFNCKSCLFPMISFEHIKKKSFIHNSIQKVKKMKTKFYYNFSLRSENKNKIR